MITTDGDEYELTEWNLAQEEDQQLLNAELDNLDDFLLMDQS